MKWIIDRFEENFAVIECENKFFNIPKDALPEKVCEGDVIEITVNIEETENRKTKISNRLKNIFGE